MSGPDGGAAPRTARVCRRTRETTVELRLALDGQAGGEIRTGSGFLDHLLATLARNARLQLDLTAQGDGGETGPHHTAEDCGIALGEALRFAIYGAASVPTGQAAPAVARYGTATRPMDEALVAASVDLCGRVGCHMHGVPEREVAGAGFATADLAALLGGIAAGGLLTMHVSFMAGTDGHHILEAIAKAVGAAIGAAARPDPTAVDGGRHSTKGTVELAVTPW